jgi:hypothetical protein
VWPIVAAKESLCDILLSLDLKFKEQEEGNKWRVPFLKRGIR